MPALCSMTLATVQWSVLKQVAAYRYPFLRTILFTLLRLIP